MPSKNKIENDLMLKFFRQELTIEEQEILREQLKSSEDERKQFNELQFIFDATHAIQLEKSAHSAQAEERIRRKLKNTARILSFQKAMMRTAAILTLPFMLCSTYLYIQWQSEKNNTAYNQVACLDGKVSLVTLPDGSKVYLHNGSTLRYPNKFVNDERCVELQGEGYFEVESDKQKPFYVQTHDGSRVKAYGTAFNVTAYEKEDKIMVFLAKGAVDFTSEKVKKAIILKPGIELTYHKKNGSFEKQIKQESECTDWINGKLVFTKSPIEEVAQKLSKHYNTDIIVKDERLKKYFFDATFTDETIYQVLNMLKQSSPKLVWEIVQAQDSTDNRQKITLTMSNKQKK